MKRRATAGNAAACDRKAGEKKNQVGKTCTKKELGAGNKERLRTGQAQTHTDTKVKSNQIKANLSDSQHQPQSASATHEPQSSKLDEQ